MLAVSSKELFLSRFSGGSNQFASWIHVRVSDLVYRTGETIYSAEQTESHATWIEFSFEMRGTTKFVHKRPVRKVEN